MEWGSSFADGDIGLCEQELNRKSEALDMKSDTGCDIFWQAMSKTPRIHEYLQRFSLKIELLCGLLICAMQRRHGS
ncbi:hypothetical protein X738_01415 [Mesorhizobium sp. LNHC209A00]|nr:hypothetical protein X741_02025 [Mesorhizobium sp. LNHC229A00]ESZ01864.1 hypothetical protein X738_01415 [Mesorhizobium sp. LNHC209A00]